MTDLPRWLEDALWVGGRWVRVGEDGLVGTSINGATWRWLWSRSNPEDSYGLADVSAHGRDLVVVGQLTERHTGPLGYLLSSADGVSFVTESRGGPRLFGVDWVGGWTTGRWLAVGDSGTALTRADNGSWVPYIEADPGRWYVAAAGSDSVIVLVGRVDRRLTVFAGGQLTDIPLPDVGTPRDVVWTGEYFVVVGSDLVGWSEEGVTWSFTRTGRSLAKVASAGHRLVAVGEIGTAAWSDDGRHWDFVELASEASFTELVWRIGLSPAVAATRWPSCWKALTARCGLRCPGRLGTP